MILQKITTAVSSSLRIRGMLCCAQIATVAICGTACTTKTQTETESGEEALFSVEANGPLRIKWQGRTLAVDELLAVSTGLRDPEGRSQTVVNGARVFNSWQSRDPNQAVTYRREVVLGDDEVVVAMEFRVPAYYFGAGTEDLESFYRMIFPFDDLEGLKYQAKMKQSHGRTKDVSGTIGTDPKPDFVGQIVYLTLTDQAGETVSIDFAPTGVAAFNGYVNPSTLPSAWWGRGANGWIRAGFGRLKASRDPYNGVYIGNVRISTDSFEDYDRVRAHQQYIYHMELFPLRQLSFGMNQPSEVRDPAKSGEIEETEWLSRKGQYDFWTPVGETEYSASSGMGWMSPARVNLEGDSSQGVLLGRATGTTPQTFRIDIAEPGIYIFTVRSGAGEQAIGPFNLFAAGQPAVENLVVDPANVGVLTFARFLQQGSVDLEFSGDWAVSTIALQPLLHESEDYGVRRGFWTAADIPTPTTLYQFETTSPTALAAVETYPLFPPQDMPEKAKTPRRSISFDAKSARADWVWASNIAALGPGNSGSFYEFETDAHINRRLDDLAQANVNTLLLNGLLVRHAFPHEYERIEKTIKRIAELAHQRGMKVVDHFDVTLLPNMGVAYQRLLSDVDWALKDVSNSQITRGYCINNPGFRSHFFDRLKRHVRETGIDGVMLDEMSFHRFNYCGCVHCRAKYTEDTGMFFPVVDASREIRNPTSRQWKQWKAWRAATLDDFGVDLMQEFQQINPEFVWMKYSAPSGFARPPIGELARAGGWFEGASHFSNFLGIELLSDNVHATRRSNLAIGTIFKGISANTHAPGFALVYHKHRTDIAYSGWAMNNMNNMRTWFIQGNPEIEADSSRYFNWENNMPAESVRRVADVVLIASAEARNLAGDPDTYLRELMGMCEQLDDLHVPHEIMQAQQVTAERLAQYRVVMLPSVSALSDETLDVLRTYLQGGGKVFATGAAASEDELGLARESWPIGEWLGLEVSGPLGKDLTVVNRFGENLKTPLGLPVSWGVAALSKDAAASSEVLSVFEGQGRENAPAIVMKNIGSGVLLWSAPLLGGENYEADNKGGRKWVFQENPASLKLLEILLNGLLRDHAVFQPVELPTSVKIRLYSDHKGSGAGTHYLHLYNGSGVTVKRGAKVPKYPPQKPYPAVGEISFEMLLPGPPPNADFVSPDFPEIKSVAVKALGEDRYLFTLPEGSLDAYGIVRIRQ